MHSVQNTGQILECDYTHRYSHLQCHCYYCDLQSKSGFQRLLYHFTTGNPSDNDKQ
jgi:hypothetical protein